MAKLTVVGFKHRIKEEKAIIKEAKRNIKMYKLLTKQVKTAQKLDDLNKEKKGVKTHNLDWRKYVQT